MTNSTISTPSSNERKLTKLEIITYLNLYITFLNKLTKKENFTKPYFQIFNECTVPPTSIFENISIVDYERMIQIVQVLTANKLFSFAHEAHFKYLIKEQLNLEQYRSKIIIEGNPNLNVSTILNYIRNAFNHNDQETQEIFRLLENPTTGHLTIDIFLKIPNFHVKMLISDYIELMKNLFTSQSAYGGYFTNQKGQQLTNTNLINSIKNRNLIYTSEHFYNFDPTKNTYKDNSSGLTFVSSNISPTKKTSKQLIFTDPEFNVIETKKSTMELYCGLDCTAFYPNFAIDLVPLGYHKISKYYFDLFEFIDSLYDKYTTFNNYISLQKTKKYPNKLMELEALYNLLTPNDLYIRGICLYLSYAFDSFITTETIIINNQRYNRNKIRNALVHGRWYNWLDSNQHNKIKLFDYPNGENNRYEYNFIQEFMISALLNYVKEYYINKLQTSPATFLDIPLTIIPIQNGEKGLVIVLRKNKIEYICNLSLIEKLPPWTIIVNKFGTPSLANASDLKIIFSELFNAKIPEEYQQFLPLIKCFPQNYNHLQNVLNYSTTQEEIALNMSKEIKQLSLICQKMQKNLTKKGKHLLI